jgi:hypothetical protein
MAMFAIAIPVLAGKADQLNKLTGELGGSRKSDFVANRKKLGVRERTFFQQTPLGDMVIVTLEGEDPEAAFAKFGQGSDPFTTWFKREVKDIHGVDLDAPPQRALPKLIVDSGA